MAGVAVAVCLWVTGAAGAAAAAAGDPPLVGSGDIHFRLGLADFRTASGATEIELYFEIDNDDLRFEALEGRRRSRLRLGVDFVAGGKRVEHWSSEPEIWVPNEAVATSPARTQILQVRLAAPAGTDSLLAVVQDLNARKRGLLHVFARTPRRGEVGTRVTLRRFPSGQLSISDLVFVQQITAAEPGAIFVKSGLDVEPSPGRVFGRRRQHVQVYYEVYDLRPPPPAGRRGYELRYAIDDPDGGPLREWSKRLSSSSAAWADTLAFPIEGYEPGSYRLSVTVREEDAPARALISGRFEVFWAADDWVAWTAEQEALARFFLDSIAYDAFVQLGVGMRERYVRAFWESVNTDDSGLGGNPVREEFMRRVGHARDHFSNNLLPGIQTDRGRVYIKYGEPDDIDREIIPIQGNDLNAAIRQLEREGGGGLSGTHKIDDRGDSRAFEVWIYQQRGYQLFDAQRSMSTGLGMQFIFVDDLGTAQNYRLIRSTEPLDF